MVENHLTVLAQPKQVWLCTPLWAAPEAVNILVLQKRMNRGAVAEIETQLARENRRGNLKIYSADASPPRDSDFPEFFCDLRQGILQRSSGSEDIIHSVILKNRAIADI